MTGPRTYEWSAIRDRASEVFGEPPNAELERELLAVFMDRPEALVAMLKGVADAVRAGRVGSGWGLARTELCALRAPDRVATGFAEAQARRDRALQGALAWVRNVGGLYETEGQVVSELFGEHGRFKRWPDLEPEVLAEWRRARPA